MAAREGARFAVLIGEAEAAQGRLILRDLAAGEQREIPAVQLAEHLAPAREVAR